MTNPVSPNANLVAFPRDPWGFTTNLRKYGLAAASGIKGDDEKHVLYLQTLQILAGHALARLEADKALKAERLERIAGVPARAVAETVNQAE